MSDVIYRTSGPWGAGLGADLTANQVDTNFWILYSLILDLQDTPPDTIAYFTVTGNQLYITMTDHFVFGPFTIPTAAFNFRGHWEPHNAYAVNDVFTDDGAVYLVIYPQTDSGATFNPNANDGMGHNFYALLLAAPPDFIPDTGEPGQFLQWPAGGSPDDVIWAYVNRPLGVYIEEAADSDEVLVQYVFAESTRFVAGLTGSHVVVGFFGTTAQVWDIFKNATNIGSVNFVVSPSDEASFTFPAEIIFHAGDVLTIVAPHSADPHLAEVSITLLGQVVLP